MENATRRLFCIQSLALAGAVHCSGGEVVPADPDYPLALVGRLSDLSRGSSRAFHYLSETLGKHLLIRLDQPCQNGVGPGNDVVAFHGFEGESFDLRESLLKSGAQTYDLTNRGSVVEGRSDFPLMQVRLIVRGDEIYAAGYLPA